ncbi:TetR/AcrR family transcriptional regulator C-terminal domain-containing protein [Henriciella sp.]|uniref:TetR/AcrR family transcriptional regulator C-terminal domain-containing protein n=1 Tax=Henriciella sp. TaxID=1968823 RepID=UPI0026390A82|nr:TetR/AcrR family transcriptional regulator C-terminal domain-containing protein [Henriciella sp.]
MRQGSNVAEQAPLNRERIVEAALALLDETGLDGLSTRRLAADLGIKSASLYWHFSNKDELLDAMCSALFDECLDIIDTGRQNFNWRKWLAGGTRGIRRTALSRRDGARVMARVRPVGEASARRIEANTAFLQSIGLTYEESTYALLALRRYAVGSALQEQVYAAVGQAATQDESEASFEYGLSLILDGLASRFSPLEFTPPEK